jgi:hypothetical protein
MKWQAINSNSTEAELLRKDRETTY